MPVSLGAGKYDPRYEQQGGGGFNPFDAFSSSGGRAAANAGYKSQRGGYESGFGAAQGFGNRAIGELNRGQRRAIGALGGGDRFYRKGISAYRGLSNRGNRGLDLYDRLVGVRGGGNKAQKTLENLPGYKFATDQAEQSVLRNANARGLLSSGNTSIDLSNQIQGVANQNYFNYLNSLNPYFGLAQSGAAGQAAGYGNLAQNAANKANIYQGTAGQIAGINQGLGTLGYNANVGLGQAGADQAANIYNADQAASGNFWNALLGLGGAAAGGIGAYTGAGGAF